MKTVISIAMLVAVLASIHVSARPDNKLTIISSQPVSEEESTAISNALTEVFEDAKVLGFKNMLRHVNYTVIIKSDCRILVTENVFLIRLDEYNNTIYDINPDPIIGELYATEVVQAPRTDIEICWDKPSKMAYSTRSGAEHLILYFNDRKQYEETRVHGKPHPLIPDRNEPPRSRRRAGR